MHDLGRIILGNDDRELVSCEDDDAAVVHQPVVLYCIHLLHVGRGEDISISSVLDLGAESLRAVEVECHIDASFILVHLSYLAESAGQRSRCKDGELFWLLGESRRYSQRLGPQTMQQIHIYSSSILSSS